MTCASLFSGLGGFDIAAEWMGWETLLQCEINPFAQKVLKYYWPDAELFTDITKTDFTRYEGLIDILTGGFPCQPYSVAGKQQGKDDERHLWPHMLRAIREIKPRWVVGENVRGLVSWSGGLVFDEVQSDLEAEGYTVLPFLLPACAVGAPHRRERIWFVAYCADTGAEGLRKSPLSVHGFSNVTDTESIGSQQSGQTRNRRTGFANNYSGDVTDTRSEGLQGRQIDGGTGTFRQVGNEQLAGCLPPDWQNFPTQSPVRCGDDGLPCELDGITFSKWRNESIKGYGNAIVPQVVLQIYDAIEMYDALY